MRRVVNFSCGAASAVAAKLAVETYGDACVVVYADTMATEHGDNARFFADVERWIGRRIRKVRSEKYATVDEVFEKRRYMVGLKGAACTTQMKKLPLDAFRSPEDILILGFTADEQKRADDLEERNPSLRLEWLLIDRGITKAECLARLTSAGIALPAMYLLGFDHNNCKGCVKSQSAGYWNRTRRLFPEVFERRARQSRALNLQLVRLGGGDRKRLFLDELPLNADAPDDEIECGPVCQMQLFPEAA